ncbi:class F sortase [Ornithinimicrobium sp. F0845]|uniref:class F sortase n=1 Tax=Ornithinimicrobium sp. F0845 TaxID=2926412 RepID=UPI001FF54A72|nr:class F sortase [Ornithinimicrobium sp. F0845]MCK0113094.1 class F sortase [Ornithinimicrobium sp. F0845]
MLVSLVLAGWAARGLLDEPVPEVDAFGSSPLSLGLPSPSATGMPSSPDAPHLARSLPRPARAPAALAPVAEGREPVRLRVPAVELDVELEAVGVATDGQMEIPDDGDRAGWYRHGPRPGDDGSVVIAAHVDTRSGPGAFLALTGVAEGDVVRVELADGSSTAYRVVGGEQVAKRDLPVDELFRRDGDPVLRLVTCSGDWSPGASSYTDNLVISAVPVGPTEATEGV